MTTSISGYASMAAIGYGVGSAGGTSAPDPSKMVEDLFSELDTEGKGYLEASDLQAAFDSIDASDDSEAAASAEEVFSALDTDGDGQLTSDEMAESMQTLADSLGYAQQMNGGMGGMSGMESMGGMGAMGGMPPPPPPSGAGAGEEDEGFTEEELTEQLAALNEQEELSEADESRAELISSVLADFETADTDGDGRVSFQEAMALEEGDSESDTEATTTTTTTDTTDSTDTTTSTTSEDQLMRRITQLMHAYTTPYEDEQAAEILSLSV